MTYYDSDGQTDNAISIIPTVLSDVNSYLITVGINRGMRRVVSNADYGPSSISLQSDAVIQMKYEGPRLPHEIMFAIGSFMYEATSAAGDTLLKVVSTQQTSSIITSFIMDDAREMIFAMEKYFGKSLTDTDLCLIMVPGKNIFKAGTYVIVIGTEVTVPPIQVD
ncbi:hypothetical protein AB6A40_002052 [Gnathostoma spinigerum]|uniref:Uncharacterized protein n=1 Tax=Gnathostoma spinigerum TaxID=75299 RepID=A0ABD6EEP1_9BILA